MSKFELVFDLIVAFLIFGGLGTIGGFLALLFWSGFAFDMLLRATMVIGIISGIVGAAIPFLRKSAIFVLSLFAPSNW